MFKEAIKFLTELGQTQIINLNGQDYASKQIHHIQEPSPAHLEISTLTGLVDYIKSKIDGDYQSEYEMLIQVCSPKVVKLLSPLKIDTNRDCFIQCGALIPEIPLNRFIDVENFNILLQSCFLFNDDQEAILKVVGNIREENVRTTGDDGISQSVTAKVGIAKLGDVVVPNPVLLRPYRTFVEVEQPESKFIFRMQDGPKAALFEADGGAWKLSAMLNIKEYLEKELQDCNVKIIA